MSYSWDCYAETIFEREIWMLQNICPEEYKPKKDIIENYLKDRLKEIKEKYKD